jgi:uncharacterized surface anchored protein
MAGGGYYSQMIEYDGETHELYITNYPATGSVYLHKSGNDGRNIQGAVFSIYRADNDEWIEDITASGNGYAYSGPLPIGDYYTVEKSVPAPYALDTTRHDFSISYDGDTEYFSLTNDREGENGTIKVIKTDDGANPVPLSGVAGYEMESGQIPFTIDGTGATIEKTVVNPKIRVFGKVKVIKTDDEGNHVSSVRLGVYCLNNNLLEELITGEDGTATSGILNEGTNYYILEHEGVAGYVADTETRYPFDIAENGVIVPMAVENPRITGSVKVIKDDGEGSPPCWCCVRALQGR